MVGVSIPHRYGKNALKKQKRPQKTKVSIPHRYGKNPFSVHV